MPSLPPTPPEPASAERPGNPPDAGSAVPAPPRSARWAWLRPVFVLGVLPNLLLGVAALAIGDRPLVDLDYLAVVAAAPFAGTALLTALLTLALLADVVFTFAPAFHFGSTEIVAAVGQVWHFTGPRAAVTVAGVVLGALLAAIVLVRLSGRRRLPPSAPEPVLAGLLLAATSFAADVANGSHVIGWKARAVIGADVATSRIAEAIRGSTAAPKSGEPMPAATDALRERVRGAIAAGWTGPEKVVLIVVEAMGWPRGGDERQLFAPLLADELTRRYDVRTGHVNFYGATTSGEFRALCGLRLSHFSARTASLDDCLPRRFASLGFETEAFHAYTGDLFQRREWYPRVGFQRMTFAEEIAAGPRRLAECGVMFRGACDTSMTVLLREALARAPEQRQFLYWLTLSSHFPLDPASAGSPQVCARIGRVGRQPEVCRLWSVLWPVFESVARMAADSTLPPAWYLLVGDHAPSRLFSAADLYDQERVPFVELRPRVSGPAGRRGSD